MKTIINFFTPSRVLAVAAYAVTCTALFVIQYQLFGGAMKTWFMVALLYPLSVGMKALYADDKTEEEPAAPQGPSRFKRFATAALAVALFAAPVVGLAVFFASGGDAIEGDSIVRTGSLRGLQALTVGVLFGILPKTRIPKRFDFSVYYFAVLAVTVAYLLLARPVMVPTVRNALQGKGYQHVSYVMYVQDEFALFMHLLEAEPERRAAVQDWGVYLFAGEMDGVEFGIIVNIADGDIVLRTDLSENNTLSRIIEQRRR